MGTEIETPNLNMPDEDFLNSSPPPSDKESTVVETTDITTSQESVTETDETPTETVVASIGSDGSAVETDTVELGDVPPGSEVDKETVDNPVGTKEDSQKNTPAQGVVEEPNHKEFFEKVMAPFKANGKTIEIKSPDEAIQLMKMGANYTRKMQEIAPRRKLLLMLENNGLLDENRLSYLIDLDKKNPEAIKKLIKDSGIDPLEVDLSVEPKYVGGTHHVSNEAVAVHAALEDLGSTQEGKETIRAITEWDQASKDILWKNPELFETIHSQRENGVYDRIYAEIHRLNTLGQIPANVSFLDAYKVVGDKIAAEGGFDDIKAKQTITKTPIATRVAVPKTDGTKNMVAAAAPPRTQTKVTETKPNPLGLSDEDFMKELEAWRGRI